MLNHSRRISRFLAPLMILGFALPSDIHPEQAASADLRLNRGTLCPQQSPAVRAGLEEILQPSASEVSHWVDVL